MSWGKIRGLFSKINGFFLKENSSEYQRMLAGIRVFFSMLKQRSFVNVIPLLTDFIITLCLNFASIYIMKPIKPIIPIPTIQIKTVKIVSNIAAIIFLCSSHALRTKFTVRTFRVSSGISL